ncbi:MAG: putative glycoside hydrolase [Spirochaetales bacterium]
MIYKVSAALTLLLIAPAFLAAQYTGGPQPLPEGTAIARITPRSTLERSTDGGWSWEPVPGLPGRAIPADRVGEPLPVTAVASQHPGANRPDARTAYALSPSLKQSGFTVAFPGQPTLVAVGARLFESRSGLAGWEEIDLTEIINQSTYVTSIVIHPDDAEHWLIGTSYDGIYESRDGGRSWVSLTGDRNLWPKYQGAGFFEEVSEMWFTIDRTVLAEIGMGGGFLEIELDPLKVTRIDLATDAERLRDVIGARLWHPEHETALWQVEQAELSAEAAARLEQSADKTGIYISAVNASLDKLDGYLDLVERMGYNSIVVDFKDDEGRITYESQLPMPNDVGAVVPMVEAEELIRRAHERGVYVIARFVVFKDPMLWRYRNHRYAYWDGRFNRPWAVWRTYVNPETEESRTVMVEQWADAYSSEVWEYNIALAREIESLGVDEIQFDYIRFPSDGNTVDIESRYAVEGADRVQALESFLSAAREALSVPISIDIFGFNGWARMSYLGQDITRLTRYVDVISPMFYPSHFARAFLPQFSYLGRAEVIYDRGTYLARMLAGPNTHIRPYIQAFLIGSELEFERPTFERYLEVQVEGSLNAGASGYTLWNASGRYYMLPQ